MIQVQFGHDYHEERAFRVLSLKSIVTKFKYDMTYFFKGLSDSAVALLKLFSE